MAKHRSHYEGTIYFAEDKKLRVAKTPLPDGKCKAQYNKSRKVVREWLQTSLGAVETGHFSF
jgi:hypothetical protein